MGPGQRGRLLLGARVRRDGQPGHGRRVDRVLRRAQGPARGRGGHVAQGDRADLRGAPDTRGQQVRRRPRQEGGVRGAQERVLRTQRAGRGKGARRVRGKRARPEIPVGGRHVETLVGPVRPVPAVPAHAPPGGVHHQQHRIARLPAAQGQPQPQPVPQRPGRGQAVLAGNLRHRGQTQPQTRQRRQQNQAQKRGKAHRGAHDDQLETGPRPTRGRIPRTNGTLFIKHTPNTNNLTSSDQVAAEEPDRVLHRAFLPTGIGVAEPRVDAVVREERVEHRGGRHLAPRVPAFRAGGVVHDDHGRDSADVLEHLDRPVAQAFRVLPGQARRVAHVRMGERDDQAVVVHELAGDAGLRHAEIDLRDAGRPDELAVSVGTALVRLAPASHVPQRRRVLAVVLGLRAEPVVHAFGGVALLAGQHAVGLEPSVDQRRVRVDLGAAAPVRGRFRRHVVHVGVFRDSGAVHVQPPRDLRPGHSLTVQSPDILLFGHRYRHRPFLPERRRLQPADLFLGCVSGIYRHGGLVPVFVWAVIWCSSRWKSAAYAAEK